MLRNAGTRRKRISPARGGMGGEHAIDNALGLQLTLTKRSRRSQSRVAANMRQMLRSEIYWNYKC